MIELIAVMTIILILAGLLLTALARARNRALRVAALTEIKQIETAWERYFAEYQTWPSNDFRETETILDGTLAGILDGNNPKNISFMHFSRVNTSSNPISPWGNKGGAGTGEDCFYCQFDTDYDQNILFQTNTIRRSVIVWTLDQNARTDDPDRIIGSWK